MYRRTKLKTFADLTHAHEPKTIAAKNSTQESRIFHQKEKRVEADIFVSFLAYCLHVTLGQRLRTLAPGLTPRSVLEKFAAVQMIDVHLPTTDGRQITLTRYTQPEPELKLLLDKLKLQLPAQPPPKISAAQTTSAIPL